MLCVCVVCMGVYYVFVRACVRERETERIRVQCAFVFRDLSLDRPHAHSLSILHTPSPPARLYLSVAFPLALARVHTRLCTHTNPLSPPPKSPNYPPHTRTHTHRPVRTHTIFPILILALILAKHLLLRTRIRMMVCMRV